MWRNEYIEMDRHFPIMVKWWEKRAFPAANPRFVPPTGLMVYYKDRPVVGGFLFKSDANAAIIGNIVADPDMDPYLRREGLDYLIMSLTDIAREQGFEMVCASTNLEGLMARYRKLGFKMTDEGVSNFGRIF